MAARLRDSVAGDFVAVRGIPARGADIESRPRVLWGPQEKHAVLRELGTRFDPRQASGGGTRFHWEDLAVTESEDVSGRASEQLGEGRAKLSVNAARARSALIEAVHKHGIAIIDHVPDAEDQGILLANSVVGAVGLQTSVTSL